MVEPLLVNLGKRFWVVKVNAHFSSTNDVHDAEVLVFHDRQPARNPVFWYEQVCHLVVVDLEHDARELICILGFCLQIAAQKLKCLLDESVLLFCSSRYGEGLARTSLAEGKDGDLQALESIFDQLFDGLKHSCLSGILSEDAVKREHTPELGLGN